MRDFEPDRLSYDREDRAGHFGGLTRRDGLAVLMGAAALATGCASKPVVTPVSLTLVGGTDMNPDVRNRASPLATRVYVLKASAAFESADFFSLFEKDSATLGADLVKREDVLLTPGANHKLDMILAADVKALGVMAAYRDLNRARWREVIPLTPGNLFNAQLLFGALQIQVRNTPAK